VEKGPKLSSILHKADEKADAPYFTDGRVPDKYTLTPKLWTYLQNYADKHRQAGNGFGFGLVEPHNTART